MRCALSQLLDGTYLARLMRPGTASGRSFPRLAAAQPDARGLLVSRRGGRGRARAEPITPAAQAKLSRSSIGKRVEPACVLVVLSHVEIDAAALARLSSVLDGGADDAGWVFEDLRILTRRKVDDLQVFHLPKIEGCGLVIKERFAASSVPQVDLLAIHAHDVDHDLVGSVLLPVQRRNFPAQASDAVADVLYREERLDVRGPSFSSLQDVLHGLHLHTRNQASVSTPRRCK
eukprot:scaffold1659_cov255-Pinguiococcus_pyrenoidosus.AAC.31